MREKKKDCKGIRCMRVCIVNGVRLCCDYSFVLCVCVDDSLFL